MVIDFTTHPVVCVYWTGKICLLPCTLLRRTSRSDYATLVGIFSQHNRTLQKAPNLHWSDEELLISKLRFVQFPHDHFEVKPTACIYKIKGENNKTWPGLEVMRFFPSLWFSFSLGPKKSWRLSRGLKLMMERVKKSLATRFRIMSAFQKDFFSMVSESSSACLHPRNYLPSQLKPLIPG